MTWIQLEWIEFWGPIESHPTSSFVQSGDGYRLAYSPDGCVVSVATGGGPPTWYPREAVRRMRAYEGAEMKAPETSAPVVDAELRPRRPGRPPKAARVSEGANRMGSTTAPVAGASDKGLLASALSGMAGRASNR